MLNLKRLDDIEEADLRGLITNEVQENQVLEFKAAVNLSVPNARPEFLRDLSSLANASGGDLVIGIEEMDGKAVRIRGSQSPSSDQLQIQIRDLCRAHISPAIQGMQMKAIPLVAGVYALVIRIPRSWNGPHMVTYENDDRCYIRDQAGKRTMKIPDLREAMLYGERAAERMKQFRMERIGNIVAGETPIPLSSRTCLMLHVLPLVSFTQRFEVDINRLLDQQVMLRPMRVDGWNSRMNLDGILGYSGYDQGEPGTSYLLAFRTGILEAVESDSLSPRQDKKRFFIWQQQMIREGLDTCLAILKFLNIPLPEFGMVSATNVRGYLVHVSPEFAPRSLAPFDRDMLVLPEFLIENYETTSFDLLKESLRLWWQACGLTWQPVAEHLR